MAAGALLRAVILFSSAALVLCVADVDNKKWVFSCVSPIS